MRKALNENPIVQVGLLGLLAVIVGVLFLTRMSGGSPSSEPAADATSSATVTPAPSVDTSAPAPSAPTEPTTPVAAESEFTAGPGLPAKVVDAYDGGEAVVLLIVHRKGLDDRKLEAKIDAANVGDTTIFIVNADDIADYSRIAEGVDVDRVPALVVIEPKSQADGPLPAASISYGYRGPESVAQAVRDALYKGPDNLPYHPE